VGAATVAAHADCIDDAAARHQVNALVLRAIGWHESRLQPAAVGRNANGSIDLGAFQINSVHLSELRHYGIDRAALADGCVSAEVAAWHYRRQVELQGPGWRAVGAYHSHTPARAAWYANQIAAILMRWNALPGGALPFPVDRTTAPARPSRPALPAAMSSPPADSAPPAKDAGRVRFGEIAYLPSAR
jgi:soluble lytic murein transglycosylase-like protein